jgi:MFS family permease
MHLNLILLIQLFNHTCFRGSKVLITLFAIELGANPIIAGVLFSMYSVLPTFLSVFAGRFTDRVGFRTPMLIGTFGIMCGLALPFFYPSLWALFFSATIAGTSYIFYTVSVQNLVGSLGGASARTRNYAMYALCVSVTALTGPVIAGFSLEHIGGAQSYLLFACIPLVSLLLLMSPLIARLPRGISNRTGEKRSAMDLLRNAPLRRVLIVAGVIETGNELGNFLLPVYGTQIGLSPSQIGIVMGTWAAATFVVRALIPKMVQRTSEITVLAGSLTLAAMACIAMPFVETFVSVSLVAFVLGLGIGGGAPLSMSLVFARSPEGRSGEAMGMRQTVNKGTEMVVPVAFGVVSTSFGMLPVFWLVAAFLGVGGWFMRRDQTPTKPGS